jgi:hypothetical protein
MKFGIRRYTLEAVEEWRIGMNLEIFVAYLNVLLQQLLGRADENCENP